MLRATYVWVTISSSTGTKDTFLAGGKKTLRVVLGLALVVNDVCRESLKTSEFFKIGRTPSGCPRSYGALRRNGVEEFDFVLGRMAGEAVAEFGEGLMVRSNVLLNVLSVVGVTVDMVSTLLLAVLDVVP